MEVFDGPGLRGGKGLCLLKGGKVQIEEESGQVLTVYAEQAVAD